MSVLLCEVSSVVAADHRGHDSARSPKVVGSSDPARGNVAPGSVTLLGGSGSGVGWGRGSQIAVGSTVGVSSGPIVLDVALTELLVGLRSTGWHLVGVRSGDLVDGVPSLFDEWFDVGQDQRGRALTDPRVFSALIRTYSDRGPRLYVDSAVAAISAARRSGIDAHLYRGAAGLRTACLELTDSSSAMS